jgi:hypothetical protein
MTENSQAAREELVRRRLFSPTTRRASRPVTPQRTERPPLSFAQHRVWFVDHLQPGSLAYVIPAAYRIAGELNAPALERALGTVVERHESLRTRFAVADGRPYQQIDPVDCTVPVIDLSTSDDPEAAARAAAVAEAQTSFDLATGPLLRARLLHLGPSDHVLLISVHHSVFDGLSLGILARELSVAYPAALAGEPARLPELAMQYADFAVWQRQHLSADRLQRHLDYWRKRLDGVAPALELPTDRPRLRTPSFRGGVYAFSVPQETATGLRELAKRHTASLYMVALAAYQAVLSRHAMVTDVVVGSPIGGRLRSEVEDLIGFFVNTVALRADLSGDPPFDELLSQVRDTTLEAYEHQELPFEKLVEELAPPREMSRNPVVQVWFNMLTEDSDRDFGDIALPGLAVRDFPIDTITTRFELEMHLFDNGPRGLSGELIYAMDLFDRTTARWFAEHYLNFLTGVAADPSAAVSRVPITTAEELELFDNWNNPGMPVA